ncbi:MAG: polyisoprenoid-binding protein [Reyranella sp.]|uniref:YceI family protein n=1 Tax=Reyranella sp. TaxID=1929291 RepID=UPI001ACB4085|nr:YceI family protein [Reyranella sp.]MBN9090194.1 polyisoprenoid-binding protein [Reyranella sp.]
MIRIALLSLALAGMAGGVAAQSSSDKSAQDLPPGVYMGGKDLADARAGTYSIDPDHSAVLARVAHIGYSWSVFRFDRVSGKLGWDPAAPEKSTLSVAVVVESITSSVKGFASELAGDNYLKAAKFPEATFVSTAFRKGDATHGLVDGNLTLIGITKPVTFEVELVGAGKGWADMPRLGVHAVARIVPTDFGLPALFGKTIEIVVDTEFQRTP